MKSPVLYFTILNTSLYLWTKTILYTLLHKGNTVLLHKANTVHSFTQRQYCTFTQRQYCTFFYTMTTLQIKTNTKLYFNTKTKLIFYTKKQQCTCVQKDNIINVHKGVSVPVFSCVQLESCQWWAPRPCRSCGPPRRGSAQMLKIKYFLFVPILVMCTILV